MAAAHEQRLTVYRPVFWRFIKRHSIDGYGDDIYCRFFWTESFQELYVLRIEPRGLGLQWPRRGTTPTVCFPYDGPRGDGASCMINIERLAPNRAYFNLELEALEGDEKRITEIKFDGNRLRCYGGWAVEDSTTVAPTVRARTWLKLDAVLEDGPPPRLLLRVDGQLLYAMPLATRVRLRGVVLKGWANRSGRTNYARLAITDSVACAAARLVSLWLLRRANSDVALVVLAFALPAPLLDMLRANSTALRGKRALLDFPAPTTTRPALIARTACPCAANLPRADAMDLPLWQRLDHAFGLRVEERRVASQFPNDATRKHFFECESLI